MSPRPTLGPSGPLSRPRAVRLHPLVRATIALRGVDQRRIWLFVLIAVIGGVAFRAVSQSRAVVAGLGTLRPVAIATNDLAPGQPIEPVDVRWEQWPIAIASTFPGREEIDGALVRSPVRSGDPLLRSQLFDPGSAMDADDRAVTLPLPLAPPPVVPGDVVDLIGLAPGLSLGERQLVETRSLGRARVVSIDDTGLTVTVDARQVVAIVETIAIGSVEVVVTPFGS